MESSSFLIKAKARLGAVHGKSLTVEERKDAAIELAGLMLDEARRIRTHSEKKMQAELSRMMNDPLGKIFITSMTDQCFRSDSSSRIADQLTYLLEKFGIPRFLTVAKKAQLGIFKWWGKILPEPFVALAKQMIRQATAKVILPGEPEKLFQHLHKRRHEGVRINLNHLGEAILGEEEAQRRLSVYLMDLSNPEVECVSIKISTICSQLNLLSWEDTLNLLASRLRSLYRAAIDHSFLQPDGQRVPKFINLDMEEYRDLHLTVALFRRVLEEPEFHHYTAGIVLQSYLPDSFSIQQELTHWAMQRLANGGAPIKIRIVKGANLAMEKVEASLRGWEQAPYTNKSEVDANYKRMVVYGSEPAHARAAHIGIASHNLFDIAYALLLRAERGVEQYVGFEMLEGMADHIRRVIQQLSSDMLLYCPVATKEEFQNAVAYLMRRLEENTEPESFLRHAFDMTPTTSTWQIQADRFSKACQAAQTVSIIPRRQQNRFFSPEKTETCPLFHNEADTDWSLPQNRKWAETIIQEASKYNFSNIPLVIGKQTITETDPMGIGEDPSYPGKELYRYALASSGHVEMALQTAKRAEIAWAETPAKERSHLLAEVAHRLRCSRKELIGAMIADTGKVVQEADIEVSEAIDLVEYYLRTIEEMHFLEDIFWKPKGTVLVTPPWNFPCSIPTGGISAALAAGNAVIFKPAPEAVLVGWHVAKAFWEGGIGQDILQFVPCLDEPIGSMLLKDPRVAASVLTGATATAKLFLKMRPGLDLIAETGGKNALIISNMADRDLAIKDLIASAFGYAGQKCSACSLAICLAEVYDDPHFRQQLRDAAASLRIGSPWDLATRLNPLIHVPNPTLWRGLTLLEEGEEWLLMPQQQPLNPNLWSPGIKLGVKPGNFTHQNELFGPVLGVMRADSLSHAIELVNQTPYGLTSGLHSLDEREHHYWLEHIEAGNCYINRGITGAVVQRQPFGGCKESSFGRGAKAGGPNYVTQMMRPEQVGLPKNQESLEGSVEDLNEQMREMDLSKEQRELWTSSLGSYAFFWKFYFSKDHDPSQLVGQDNILRYKPHRQIAMRVQAEDNVTDVMRIIAAVLICKAPLEISVASDKKSSIMQGKWQKKAPQILTVTETEEQFIARVIRKGKIKRIRLLSTPSVALQQAFAEAACQVILEPVLANGRIELLNYLREISISIDYHRYGNLGVREGEERSPKMKKACETCCCY
jgi:RHH-type transcriptional regulator, proline utilization regulon repressor / proline dehydrogenase / delta 1-pyrroline-5-carboxylate dehydrogenase